MLENIFELAKEKDFIDKIDHLYEEAFRPLYEEKNGFVFLNVLTTIATKQHGYQLPHNLSKDWLQNETELEKVTKDVLQYIAEQT